MSVKAVSSASSIVTASLTNGSILKVPIFGTISSRLKWDSSTYLQPFIIFYKSESPANPLLARAKLPFSCHLSPPSRIF